MQSVGLCNIFKTMCSDFEFLSDQKQLIFEKNYELYISGWFYQNQAVLNILN